MPVQSDKAAKQLSHSGTALHDAATRGDVETLGTLLDAECDIDAPDNAERTSLMCAAQGGHADCVRLLLQRGADVNKHSRRNGCTVAHYAAGNGHKEALLAVLCAGCDVDATSNFTSTPLLYAAASGHTECVQLLLQYGADVHRLADDGSTAAHYAAQQGHKDILLAVLGAGCNINASDKQNDTPLHHAILHDFPDCVRLLLQRGADVSKCRNDEPVHTFAQRGDVETLRAFLDVGCDVDDRQIWGNTPLMIAAQEGRTGCVRLLLQRGADPNKHSDEGSNTPDHGSTAAHYAAERGHRDVLLALLDAGCGVDVKDKWDHTPLRLALKHTVSGGFPDCARLLLRRGADVRNCQTAEYTHTFARRGDEETLRALLDAGCDVDARDFAGTTPLMIAARGGHTDCVQLLLEHGASTSCLDGSGLTAAHYAVVNDNLDVVRLLTSAADPIRLDPLFHLYLPPNMPKWTNCVSLALACGCRLEVPSDAIEVPQLSCLRPIVCGYYSLSHLL